MTSILHSLKENAERVITSAEIVDREARSLNQQNEQWFINWQDKLNSISVK